MVLSEAKNTLTGTMGIEQEVLTWREWNAIISDHVPNVIGTAGERVRNESEKGVRHLTTFGNLKVTNTFYRKNFRWQF